MQRYLEVSGLKTGPLFRRIDSRSDCMGDRALTPQVVALIVKARAEAAGLDPARFAGHSLRAGFVTSAAARGVTLHNIMRQTRHKSERVAMTYIRPATVWRNNATDGLSDEPEETKR
jgi:integrase